MSGWTNPLVSCSGLPPGLCRDRARSYGMEVDACALKRSPGGGETVFPVAPGGPFQLRHLLQPDTLLKLFVQ